MSFYSWLKDYFKRVREFYGMHNKKENDAYEKMFDDNYNEVKTVNVEVQDVKRLK